MCHWSIATIRPALAVPIVLALLLALLAPAASAAQNDRGLIDDTSYQSPQFGYPVTWASPWTVQDRDVITNPGGFDTITIRSDSGTVRISGRADDYDTITFLADTIAIQEASGGVLIGQDTTGPVPTATMQIAQDMMRIDVVSLPGAGAIALVVLRANASAFDAALASAETNIQLNNAPLFGAVETSTETSDAEAAAPAPAAAQAPPSTVEVLGAGVEGNTYTSPSFGFSVSWDPAVWTLPEDAEYSEPGYDSLNLQADTGPIWITGTQAYGGDAATCLVGEQTYYNDPSLGISDWQVAVDANGAELTGTTENSAWGVFTNVYTDPDDPLAPPANYVDYIECVSLGDGESVVTFYAFAERDVYNEHIGNVLAVTGTLELPDAVSTPPPTATATETSTVPAQTPITTSGQAVTVGQTEVSWTGAWELDAESSPAGQASLTQIDPATGSVVIASYGEFADPSVTSPAQALEVFAEAFFSSAGASGQSEINGGTLADGTAWKLYRFDVQGLPLNMVITTSQNAAGAFVVSTLTANEADFATTLAQAQQEILLNGQPVFLAGLDAQTLQSAAATTTETSTATATATTEAPSPTAEGSPVDLTAGDTVTGQRYAYSFTIPAGWQASEATLGGEVERTVLTNGTSTVTIEARAMPVASMSDCVTAMGTEHQGEPAYPDMELALTAGGSPFSGEDEFSAFANFTFTGPDGDSWAHFVECRWIVEGESVLVVVHDVPEDQFGAERAARRQIQNSIEVGG